MCLKSKYILPVSGFFLSLSSDGLLLTTPVLDCLGDDNSVSISSLSLHILLWLDVLDTARCRAWSDEADTILLGEFAGDCCVACRKPAENKDEAENDYFNNQT